jgi:hypothetical protein
MRMRRLWIEESMLHVYNTITVGLSEHERGLYHVFTDDSQSNESCRKQHYVL